MERANETKTVIGCCTNDILRQSLPTLKDQLELCQKKLNQYLEQKKQIFPRFYFCSNDTLLKILSVGSNPNEVQDDFENLFEAISKVTFDETNRKLIINIVSVMGGCEEIITFVEPVLADGNIEEWMCKVEKEMQRSMQTVCAAAAGDFLSYSKPLKELIEEFPA